MSRKTTLWVVAGLALVVVAALFYFRALHQRVIGLSEDESTEERARAEVVAPPITTPSDVLVPASMYWVSTDDPTELEPIPRSLPLSADPVQRCRQLIRELVANPPSPEQRTVPASTVLLAFYLLPDGTAIADFSDSLATETPSGILSEELAVDSIVRTLAANVPQMKRLKILIHGQEAETLAGHVDLTGFFDAPPMPESTPDAAPPQLPPAIGATASHGSRAPQPH